MMSFTNNQSYAYQMPGAFPGAEKDEFGYTEEDYLGMMDDVASAIVNGHDEVSPGPRIGREERPLYGANTDGERPTAGTVRFPDSYSTEFPSYELGARYDVPASGDRRRGPVQQDSRTERPRASIHSGQNLNSQGRYRFHPYNRHQQTVPPNAFGGYGDTYPTPPIAWTNGSDNPSQNTHQDSWPSAFNSYGESYPYTSFAATSNTSSPYAANAPDVNTYSRPHMNARPTDQRLLTQPISRGSEYPRVPAAVDEAEDGEESPGEEEDEEAGEEQEPTTAKRTKKSKKASETTNTVRKGLTRVNADGELEWMATVGSEGVLAVRHDDIRPQLIAIAEAERVSLGIENEHPDEPGPGKFNVTSFYRKHVSWGPDRENRPNINYDWEEDRVKNPRPQCPGFMQWEENGKKYVVLDPHDNPVKDWDIPATIASNIPGYKLEAMRRENMSLGHKDFWARMQSQINIGTEVKPIWEELGHPNSIVNMPMERFRFHAGLCSWTNRSKTLKIKAGLKKLYGNMIQNNNVRAFGRDLTTREIKEIKKGDDAVFPIEGDVVPAAPKAVKKAQSKSIAKPTKPKDSADVEKGQSRKRKQVADDEGQSSEEDVPTRVKSHKRARRGRKEDSIAAEVDDLVMFEQSPPIIDQADFTRRYPRRSTRKDAQEPGKSGRIEELSGESSAGEKDEYAPAQTSNPLRQIRKKEGPRRENDAFEVSSRGSSVEAGDEGTPPPRFPFRRIPRPGEVGGKSKGPSWVSSTGNEDYRHTAVPVNISGKVHHATYEGLISNGPAHSVGETDTPPKAPEAIGASSAQKEPCPPQPHPFEVTMDTPWFEQRNVEDEDTPLQAHRKRVRDYLGDEEAEANAPPLKRLHTEQPVLSRPGFATHSGARNSPPQIIRPPTIPSQEDQARKTLPSPHGQASQTRKQKLEAEWAQVFEHSYINLGFQKVNYSEVPPWNAEEVQSLIDALLPTREVYFAWTGEPAPKTDPHQSYRKQFHAIFGAFQDWWREICPNEPLPILAGVMHWGRSVDDWEPPSKDSIYYEAFRKGLRAPRDERGRILGLPDWPGWRLEDAVRKGYQGGDRLEQSKA